VRRCLEGALQELGVAVTVARSDAAFDAIDGCAFDYIIMDPWTWAGPGKLSFIGPSCSFAYQNRKIFF
jgi:hypothetical protein